MGFSLIIGICERYLPRAFRAAESVGARAETAIATFRAPEKPIVDTFTRTSNPILKEAQSAPLALPKPRELPKLGVRPDFAQLTDAENAMLPKELQNTKMGRTFAQKIPEIRHLPAEKAYVIDSDGNIIIESLPGDEFSAIFGSNAKEKIQHALVEKRNLGLLHNHPFDAPLSAQDIQAMVKGNYVHMMATKPSGGHSIMSRKTCRAMVDDLFKLQDGTNEISALDNQFAFKLLRQNTNSQEFWAKLSEFRNEQYRRFSKVHSAFGFKYINTGADAAIVAEPNVVFKDLEADIYKELSDLGANPEQIKQIFDKVDETPIEQFYISN